MSNTIDTIRRMRAKAQGDYQHAATMHVMTQVSFLAGQIKAFEEVLRLLTGSADGVTKP